MACGHVKRKHLRIHLRRTDRLMTHQALQYLERNTGVQHVHRVRVSEGVRCHRHRKRDAVAGGRVHRLINPAAHRAVGDLPDARLFGLTGSLIAPLQRNF